MGIFSRKPPRRACVVGLDGVPYSLLRRLMADGTMPALARLTAQRTLARMQVSLPEISAVSWAGFMTGVNPGIHGIFGFVDLAPQSYTLTFPNFLDLKAPAIWDRLGERRQRSVVINQPMTYPARQIAGVLISGFVAVDLARAVWPRGYLRRLRALDYQIDVDVMRARTDPAYLLNALQSSLTARRRAVEAFWREPWDYFEVVVTGTDRLQHFLWDAIEDAAHPRHGDCMGYYRAVDTFVNALYRDYVELTGDADGFFVLSDHGFTGIRQEVYLNAWLREYGYLRLAPGGDSLEAVTGDSRAFALDPGRIYLHRRDRFPRGIVGPEEAEGLTVEIAAGLSALEYEGRPVVQAVHRAADLYAGPQADHACDLVAVGHDGFDLKGSLHAEAIFGRTPLQGMHTWNDAFFCAAGAGITHITDAAGQILARLQ